MIWCWHPSNRVDQQPVANDYSFCCRTCSPKICFGIFMILDVITLIVSILSLFTEEFYWVGIPYIPLTLAMILLTILVIVTSKPIYMQIFGILYIINIVLTIVTYIAAFIVSILFGLVALFFGPLGLMLVFFFGVLGFFLVVGHVSLIVWRAIISLKLYAFVRDSQLAIEQRQPPIAVFGDKIQDMP